MRYFFLFFTMILIKYIYNSLPSYKIPAPFLSYNFLPWFIIFKTLTTKRNVKVFVYTSSGNFFQFSSFTECSNALRMSRKTIRKAILENKPYKNYFFSMNLLELDNLQKLGFSIISRPKVNCTTLVPFGSYLTSNIGLGKFSKLINHMVQIPSYIQGVIVGLLLGDAWARSLNSTHQNARLGFKQGLINFPYFWHVFTLLSHYCSSYPHLTSSIRNHKQSFGIQIYTRSLSCFTQFYLLFYVNGVKVIPFDIYNLLTPVALAHWIMGDGMKDRKGLILCTDSYKVVDAIKFMNVLIIRYRLECTLRFHRPNQPRIYILVKSMPTLQSIIFPHMHPSILYKIQS